MDELMPELLKTELPPAPQQTDSTQQLPVSDPLAGILAAPHKRRGKVARKPKEIRDRINNMLLDGVSYLDIVSRLGPDGADLNDENIGRWQRGGYQEWLREQHRVDALRAKQEFALELPFEKDGNRITQANIQIVAANLCNLLLDLDPASLQESLLEDPDKFTRLINMVVRLSDGELRCEQHQAKQAALLKRKTPAEGGISDAAMQQAKDKLNLM